MANILVVGAAGGVGLAVVDKLVARGDSIILTVLNAAEASHVAQHYGAKIPIHEIDLGDADTALVGLRRVVGSIKRLDGVAMCAGIAPNGPVEVTPLATFRKTLEINCIANIALFQAALPALRKSKGTLVFISSTSGKMGMPFIGAYTASKYALEGVGDVMRREAAAQGVKVSIVEPGGIRTGMIKDQLATGMKRLAELSEENRVRYGNLYRRFEAVAGEALVTSASTAEQVADVVIGALDAAQPEPRYIAGADAKQMLDMMRTMSDREIDGLFAQMFSEQVSGAVGWAK
jgi:NAD(P)-dependent dehydrogenase (short-subunit alcohol dehydrogenase family)